MADRRDVLRAKDPPPAGVLETMARLGRCWWCWQEGCDGECPWPVMIPPWRLVRAARNMRTRHQMKRGLDRGLRQLERAAGKPGG